MSNHGLTQELLMREVFSGENKALRTEMIPMEMSMELSHLDGDSIISHKACKQDTIKSDVPEGILGLSMITVYSEPNTNVSVSPCEDKDIWFVVGATNEQGILTLNMCASRIKLSVDGYIVGV